ncbi:HYOSCYAMINE 6-DIOXYGENASE-LIKE [Salix koriyanagi]|uniref:HYOSCYAMINE 6-DIOXYGENASE-LIKE n=1 Tax=Salix koriyanagi TaxID=2511006 RepID=A0A9Q0SN71_9ROSI|nr:HYOSCYAMINE 6-DIOXYGENASE-LIKE [Salix koriyanagi]
MNVFKEFFKLPEQDKTSFYYPSLTFGVSEHCDPNLITILQQESDVFGLQVLRNGEWIGVEPISKAFVVNMGYQMQIISNNKLRSVEHRAVTNSEKARTRVTMFFIPNADSIVEPAKALVDSRNPAIFKSFQYKEFIAHFINKTGGIDVALEPFKLQA